MSSYDNPTIPFLEEFKGGLKDNQTITIEGTASESFNVNFVVLPTSKTGSILDLDSGLQINVNFKQKTVNMDSRKDMKWIRQEEWGTFPFQATTPFTLKIKTDDDLFRMYYNDVQKYSFVAREGGLVGDISHIGINGGVDVTKVVMSSVKSSGNGRAVDDDMRYH